MPIVKKGNEISRKAIEGQEENSLTTTQNGSKSFFLPQSPKYKLEDLILESETKEKLLDALSFFKHQDLIFNEWGLSETHKYQKKLSVNIYGPPGTGKTMAAHAAADYLGKEIIEVSYAEIESKFVGETPKNIEKAFKKAQENDCLLFFDEADAILSRRVSNMSNSTDVSVNQTRSVLLMLLNNFSGSVIFATNFIQNYDPAFMRRMLASIEFEMPDYEARKKLWAKLLPKKLPTNIAVENIARDFANVTGSDISNAILNASLRTAREGGDVVPVLYFSDAIESIKKAKYSNEGGGINIEKRKVSEKYVKEKLSENKIEEGAV